MVRWPKLSLHDTMNSLIFVSLLGLVLMFIHLNAVVAHQTGDTHKIVTSQQDILEAIKQLAMDTKLDSQQKLDTIICMSLVPVEQRTTNTAERCRQQVIAHSQPVNTTAPTGGSTAPKTTSTTHTTSPSSSPSNTNDTPPSASQSLIPGVSKPIIGCITEGVCI